MSGSGPVKEWQARGQKTAVSVDDDRSRAPGKAVPSGMDDLGHTGGGGIIGGQRLHVPKHVSDAAGRPSGAHALHP
jgi:hypothetical protein